MRPKNGTTYFVSSIYFRNARELDRVRAAAKRKGLGYTAFIREAALELASRILAAEKKKRAA